MTKNQKGFGALEVITLTVLACLLIGVGIYVLRNHSRPSSNGSSFSPQSASGNVRIEVITGAGEMPPASSEGEILKNEEFTVVFTEPFPSLERWHESKLLKEITFNNGEANVNLDPGKYGVYYIYNGQKQLYGDLKLENPRTDIQRDKQGPWYVEVKRFGETKLKFSVNSQPV
jgi:hypothetical protein